MQKTMQALITDVEHELSQAAGPGVQVYAEETHMRRLQQAFDFCVTKKFWSKFRRREVRTLDGVTGTITANLTDIKQWDDIQHVFRSGAQRPLSQLSANTNTLDLQTGTWPKFIEARDDEKLFTVYPVTSTGVVLVVGRARRTTDFLKTEIVPFDHLALVHYAAWSYLIDDESNPAAAAKHQGLYEQRINDLWKQDQPHSVLLGPATVDIPDRWY